MEMKKSYFTKPLVVIFAIAVIVMYLGLILKNQTMRFTGFTLMFPMAMYCISLMFRETLEIENEKNEV